mgnify:CR=1 FL=1
MLKVVLNEFTITNMLEIVYSLRAQGYKQGVDFDFTYTPEKFNNNNSFEENDEKFHLSSSQNKYINKFSDINIDSYKSDVLFSLSNKDRKSTRLNSSH